MATYVTSLESNARLAHIGSSRVALCNVVFVGRYRVSDDLPADRGVCGRCVDRALAAGTVTTEEADRLLAHRAAAPTRGGGYPQSDIAAMIALYREGLNDNAVAVRLGISLRGVVRRAAQGMAEVGARTRFQWGYLTADTA